jgi:hypothetical protein
VGSVVSTDTYYNTGTRHDSGEDNVRKGNYAVPVHQNKLVQ